MGEACRALGVPDHRRQRLALQRDRRQGHLPTPVIGVVGLLEDASKALAAWFKEEGDAVYLLGATARGPGRQRAARRWSTAASPAGRRGSTWRPRSGSTTLMAEAAAAGLLRSAHDPSDGGLAVALAECCFRGEEAGLGGRFDLPGRPACRRPALLRVAFAHGGDHSATRRGCAPPRIGTACLARGWGWSGVTGPRPRVRKPGAGPSRGRALARGLHDPGAPARLIAAPRVPAPRGKITRGGRARWEFRPQRPSSSRAWRALRNQPREVGWRPRAS